MSEIKAQWGNPPKPYLWKVESAPYDPIFEEGCYKITSPVLKGALLLNIFSNDKGYFMRVRVEGVNTPFLLIREEHNSIPDLLKYFASPAFWSEHLYNFVRRISYLKVARLG